MGALQRERTVFSVHSCIAGQPSAKEYVSKAEPEIAILFAPFGCTHSPPPVLPFLLKQNISPKDIAGSDITRWKFHAGYMYLATSGKVLNNQQNTRQFMVKESCTPVLSPERKQYVFRAKKMVHSIKFKLWHENWQTVKNSVRAAGIFIMPIYNEEENCIGAGIQQ